MQSGRALKKVVLTTIVIATVATMATMGTTAAVAQDLPSVISSDVAAGVLGPHVGYPEVDSAAAIDDLRGQLASVGVHTSPVDQAVTRGVDKFIVDVVPGARYPEQIADTSQLPPEAQDPNYVWRDDLPARLLAGKPHADYVLHRVPGSYFDAPRIPEESNQALTEGKALYGPGTPIYVGDDSMCTLTLAGIDTHGRKVGITAGHCGEVGDPVSSADAWQVGPSGTIVEKNDYYDYAVIEFGSNAEVTNSYNGVTVTDTGGTVNQGQVVCKHGVATGRSCGTTWLVGDDISVNQLCATAGDSGAPVMVGDRVVGYVSRGAIPVPGAQNLSCRTPLQGGLHAPTATGNIDQVLTRLDDGGGVGAGLRLPDGTSGR